MIKLGNLSASLRQWLMSTLQLGPGIGDVHYLVENASAFHVRLLDSRIDSAHIHTSLVAGEDALVTNRNDVLLAFPGTYTETAKTTWDKSSTHLIGLGGPIQRTPAVAGTKGAVYFTSTTVGLTELLLISGHYNQFHGFGAYLPVAAGVATINIQGRVNRLKDLYIRDGDNATQLASGVLGYALQIDPSASGYGNNNLIEDCHIGESRNTTRTAGGQILFGLTGVAAAGQQNEFKRCFIQGRAETAGCYAVKVSGNACVDRHILWEDCVFYNFWENLANTLLTVFSDDCGSTHLHMLTGKTAQYGFTAWGETTYAFAAMPIPNSAGGKMLVVT